jgi:O-acetyl-ADP-ribose deacetylase (regulator of RNase III)
MRISQENITRLNKNEIFVYGSNLSGRHGKGAALVAYKKFGATPGRCHGMDNNSYGIPTKDGDLKVLPLEKIAKYVKNFIADAQTNPDYTFHVTAIGTGLAGYAAKDIAPLFEGAQYLKNVYLPQEFWEILNHKEI